MVPEDDSGADVMDVDGLEEDAADVKARLKVPSLDSMFLDRMSHYCMLLCAKESCSPA